MSSEPIEHRGVIGNIHTAALVNVPQALVHQPLFRAAFDFDRRLRPLT